jgi:hypothetical protein
MASTERGIVLGSSFKMDVVTFSVEDAMARRFDRPENMIVTPMPQLIEPTLRRSILYFDRIELPRTGHTLPPPYQNMISFLVEHGIVESTFMAMASIYTNCDVIGLCHVKAFIMHESEEPGAWTFAPLLPAPNWGVHLFPEHSQFPSARGIEFQLLNALPVPAADVPYADILEFKERRRSELLAFRAFLDELYLGVIDSNDIPRAQLAAAVKLEKAIADVRAALDASGIRAVLQALRVDLLTAVVGGAKTGAWAAHELHQNAEYGAVIGGASALYRYIRKNVPKPISRCGALAYLGHAAQENIVKLP